jgi:hypothetical protein
VTAQKRLSCRDVSQSVCNKAVPLDEVPDRSQFVFVPVIKPPSSVALRVAGSLEATNYLDATNLQRADQDS